MERSAVVTGADRGLGLALCRKLVAQGWQVYAGQYMPDWPELGELEKASAGKLHIIPLDVGSLDSVEDAARRVAERADYVDMLISNAGIAGNCGDIREGLDFELMHQLYSVNAVGAVRLVEAFLPLMDKGNMKRLCFVSSEAGSISMSTRIRSYGYCMSKTALNMAVKIMFNDLFPQGYTFRMYHPGWLRSYMSGKKNVKASLEPEESAETAIALFAGAREDEERLVLIDEKGCEWPF